MEAEQREVKVHAHSCTTTTYSLNIPPGHNMQGKQDITIILMLIQEVCSYVKQPYTKQFSTEVEYRPDSWLPDYRVLHFPFL